MCITAQSSKGYYPYTFACLQNLVPGMRLELTRFWHRPLKTAWLPLHHPGKNSRAVLETALPYWSKSNLTKRSTGVRDERFELPTSVESGQSSTTELTAQKAVGLLQTE